MTDLPLTPDDIEQIVSILSKSEYDNLDIETSRFRLRVSRNGDGWTQEWSPIEAVTNTQAAENPASIEVADGLEAILPPLPGTFYRAPQPGAAPFVEVGDEVTADTVVAIVETMKLMNPVHAGVSGTIVEVLVDNGELIDADRVLMTVKPA